MARLLAPSSLTRGIRRPGFWFLAAVLALITVPHYSEVLHHPAFLNDLIASVGLDRHAFERVLYLAPIIWAGFLFGRKGATLTSLVALTCMLPRAVFISPHPADAVFETSAVFIVGNLVAFTFHSLHKERERRVQLDALNQISSVVSQSLELVQVLTSSIDSVIRVMKADAALVFLVDEKAGELSLAAYSGASERFARSVERIGLGEGFNGRVAESGEPLVVEDASHDPSLTKTAVAEERIVSQLIVPLKSKGRVMGTLCAAMRSYRRFREDEVELLSAIGNQIGVAVENARLYEQEREVAEQLRTSEERYRELFENAHDAIWLHDLEEKVIAANKSFVGLTGYALEELSRIKSSDLIAEGCEDTIESIGESFPTGEAMGRLSEVTLIRKDGTRATVQLSTSPVFSNGQVVAFQHIARDVTEEQRMKDNLRFYLGEITKAQEEERKRIARELHDETIQALVVLSRQLDQLTSSAKAISAEERLLVESLRQQTNSMMEGLRRLCQDLRPAALDRLGLLPALEWLASDMAKRSGIEMEVRVQGTERRLAPEVELLLFRVAQEALSNVWRHSQASRAEVTVLFEERKATITVKDNGTGFDLPRAMGDLVKEGRLGLAGMQERIRVLDGTLNVESQSGKGTTVTIEAPI